MKIVFLIAGVLILLSGCARVSPPSQREAAYAYLLSHLVFHEGKPIMDTQVPIFLGVGQPSQAQDVEPEILKRLSKIWPIQNASMVKIGQHPQHFIVKDLKTDKQGWLVWVEPAVAESGDNVVLRGGLFSDGTAFETFEISLVRDRAGKWIVSEAKVTGRG